GVGKMTLKRGDVKIATIKREPPPPPVPTEPAEDAAPGRRRPELGRQLPEAATRAYQAQVERLVAGQTAQYLLAACEYRNRRSGMGKLSLGEVANKYRVEDSLLAGWVGFLDQIAKQPTGYPLTLRDAAAGRLTGQALERSAEELQQALASRLAAEKAEPQK